MIKSLLNKRVHVTSYSFQYLFHIFYTKDSNFFMYVSFVVNRVSQNIYINPSSDLQSVKSEVTALFLWFGD